MTSEPDGETAQSTQRARAAERGVSMRIHNWFFGVLRVGRRRGGGWTRGLAPTLGLIGIGGIGHAACAGSGEIGGGDGGGKDAISIYVDDDAPLGGDGTSWNQAFGGVQSALDFVASGNPGGQYVIKVAQGIYVPTKRIVPNNPRSVTFQLIDGTSLVGGYAGIGARDPNERDPERFETILSGDLKGDDDETAASYSENAFTLLTGSGIGRESRIEGLTITATATGGIGAASFVNSSVLIQSCRFTELHFGAISCLHFSHCSSLIRNCLFDHNPCFGILSQGASSPVIDACVFSDNSTTAVLLQVGTSAVVTDCLFTHNKTVDLGGAIVSQLASSVVISQSSFSENAAHSGGGVYLAVIDEISIDRCTFEGNKATYGGAGNLECPVTHVSNCEFKSNHASSSSGAIDDFSTDSTYVNCVFATNSSDFVPSGAVKCFHYGGQYEFTNCAFFNNGTTGIGRSAAASATVANSILWGNHPGQAEAGVLISHSAVEGGWPGTGNIESDPKFIQPGCDNLRLALDSPCLDAGSDSAVPPRVTFDLDGLARIQGPAVDMGPYEGGHPMLPALACDENLDTDEQAQLTPVGGIYLPLQFAAIDCTNMTGPDNAIVSVTQLPGDVHPGAEGFNSLCPSLSIYTTLLNGETFTRVTIPFDQSSLNGFAIEDMNLTYFDAKSSAWKLAAAANTQNSPDHDGPLGDHIVVFGTGNNGGLTPDLGDYGVFWNTTLERGFVWANVDHATEFASGIALPACVGDTSYPVDKMVDVADLQKVFDNWGLTPAGPASFADIDRNGVVNIDDLLSVVRNWGPCP